MFAVICIVSIALVLQGCDGFRVLSTHNKWSSKLLSLTKDDHQPQSMRQREIGPLQRQWQSLPWLTAVVVGVTTFHPKVANAGIINMSFDTTHSMMIYPLIRHFLIQTPL